MNFSEIQANPEPFVDAVFACLESEFLVMPRGEGFVEYPTFEKGFEALKAATSGFTNLTFSAVYPTVLAEPISFVVLRTMLGFTPPEWAYLAKQRTGVDVPQGFARGQDRDIRMAPLAPLRETRGFAPRLKALIQTACVLLNEGVPAVEKGLLHRLDKADTREGISGIQAAASLGIPYAMLLYERFLGRPFAGHRDSVSELVGAGLEVAIEEMLNRSGIGYRKTRRSERVRGFDQAPDFVIPDEFNPQVVIEAKLTEDDGTARDKATRIQHLGELSRQGMTDESPRFEVIACIGGRGFAVRREDMKKILLATRGKVFTLRTMDRMVETTNLQRFKSR